jgi:hypothetical protein
MKFLADMGISPRVVDELRKKEHDAIHLVKVFTSTEEVNKSLRAVISAIPEHHVDSR